MVSIRKVFESEVIRTTNIRTEAESELGESEQYPVRSESGPVRLQPNWKMIRKNPIRMVWSESGPNDPIARSSYY